MKKNSSFALILLACTLAMLPANRGAAQAKDPFGGGGPSKGAAVVEPVTLDNARFDVEFVDTPAPDAFEFIASKLDELGAGRINIVYSKSAEAITLPTMALRQVKFEQFVSFVNRLGGAPPLYGDPSADPFAPYFPEHTGPRFGITDNDGIWYFWAEQSQATEFVPGGTAGAGGAGDGFEGGMDSGGAPETITRVIALEGDLESTLGLIEEALGESQRHSNLPQPNLKFHEPSSTLIVSGSVDDLKMIEEVISVMDARARLNYQKENESLAVQLEKEIKRLRDELDLSNRRAEEENNRISARAEQEIALLRAELAEAHKTFTKAHPKIVELQAQLDKALEELAKKK